MQRTIQLTDEQVRELERLAARERRSLDELVERAVGDYLLRRRRDWSDWDRRFDELAARVRARVPPETTAEEIEAEITASREEYRAARADRPGSGTADAGGR